MSAETTGHLRNDESVSRTTGPIDRGGALDECPVVVSDTDTTRYPRQAAALARASACTGGPSLFDVVLPIAGFAAGVFGIWRLLSLRAEAARVAAQPVLAPATGEESSLDPTKKRFGLLSRDLVEEASWESFPASDPPSFSPGT